VEECVRTTPRDDRRISLLERRVKVSHSSGITQPAKTALRGGAVNARNRAHSASAIGPQRRGVDGAEHSETIDRVMPVGP
jgi:hypothetical protein